MKDLEQARRVTAENAERSGMSFYVLENRKGDRWDYWSCLTWDTPLETNFFQPKKRAAGWHPIAKVNPRGVWSPVDPSLTP